MGKRKFKCKKCVKTFFHRSSLSRHHVKHLKNNNEIDKKFFCNLCNKTFTQKDNLKRHLRISCKKIKKFGNKKITKKKNEIKKKILKEKHNIEEKIEIKAKDINIEKNIKELKEKIDKINNPPSFQSSNNKKNINKKINVKIREEIYNKNNSKNISPKKNIINSIITLHTKNQCNETEHIFLLSKSKTIIILCEGLTYNLASKPVNPPIFDETVINNKIIKELSHYNNVKEVKGIITQKLKHLTNDLIFNSDYCSPLRCECLKKHPNGCGTCKKGGCSSCGHNCFCKDGLIKKHKHENCQHAKIRHQDHFDFIVNGVLHHEKLGRCFSHGEIKIADFKAF